MEYIIEFKSIGGEPGLTGFNFSVTKEVYNTLALALNGRIKLQVAQEEQEEKKDPEEESVPQE